MLKVGVVGIGNAGNQVADGIKAAMPEIDAVAVNSSKNDFAALNYVPAVIVGDEKGAGKDRKIAKTFVQKEIKKLLAFPEFVNVIEGNDIVFVIAGSGGGTGSGQSPVLTDILKRFYPHKIFINIGILPSLKETVAAQENTLEYLKELIGFNATYMLYDNNRRANLPTSRMLEEINKEIVEDIITLRGEYQYVTPFTSIDEKDGTKILGTPGRILVARADGFREKDLDEASIEDRLLANLNTSAHAEIDRDQIVKRMAIITNLSSKINSSFDSNVPKFKEMIGEAVEGFEHIYINPNGDDNENRVITIMSGMSMPDDRLNKIVQRIEDATEQLMNTKQSSVLGTVDTGLISELRGSDNSEQSDDTPDLDDIFSKYMK